MVKKTFLLISFSVAVLSFCLTTFARTTFTNVTKEAGLEGTPIQGSSPVWGDYDNDGDLDLYVAYSDWGFWTMGPDVFYRNNGNGTFTDVTKKAGLEKNKGACPHASFLDYDNDGYLDLYLCNSTEVDDRILLYHNNGDGTFTDVTENAGINIDWFSWSSGFADYDNDGDLDIYITLGRKNNVFYENNGDGTFSDATDKAGLGDDSREANVASGDYDNDGDMDIYIANGIAANKPTVLYHNNGDGTFTDVANKAGVNDNRSEHTVAFFDYDNDGDLDIYKVGGISPSYLYRNNGDGTFTDVANKAGVWLSNGERLTVADYDNDGYMDIFVMQWNKPRILYHNNGDGTFTDVAKEVGVNAQGKAGGCAFADYDNDGNLDLYVANIGGTDALYRNNSNDNNWLHIKAIGIRSNKGGVGARVMVRAGELSMIREINPGCSRGYNVLTAYFGLGQNTKAESVEIRWPSGQVDVYNSINANQRITVKEGVSWRRGFVGEGAVRKMGRIPTTFGEIKRSALLQNFPNPFNPETWIPYQLAEPVEVTIRIYSQSGQLVRTLRLGHKKAGIYLSKSHTGYWDGRNEASEFVASGVYFYQLEGGDFCQSRRMAVLK